MCSKIVGRNSSTEEAKEANANENAKGGSPAQQESAPQKTPPPEFVTKRQEACKTYKAESNEIRASKIFTDYLTAEESAGYKVENMDGVMDEIETTHGGSEALIKIKTSIGTFRSNDIFQGHKRQIKKGSKVYNMLADLSVGDGVIFSATLVAPDKGLTEKTAVCGDSWVALVTDIKKK